MALEFAILAQCLETTRSGLITRMARQQQPPSAQRNLFLHKYCPFCAQMRASESRRQLTVIRVEPPVIRVEPPDKDVRVDPPGLEIHNIIIESNNLT